MVFKPRAGIRVLVVGLTGSAIWVLPAAAQAKTIKVPATGRTTSIQEAVNAASPGDTVSVAPGTYTAPTLSVTRSNLTLTSSTAPTLDATGNHHGITAVSALDI